MADKLEEEERNTKGRNYDFFSLCIITCLRIGNVWDETISHKMQQKLDSKNNLEGKFEVKIGNNHINFYLKRNL